MRLRVQRSILKKFLETSIIAVVSNTGSVANVGNIRAVRSGHQSLQLLPYLTGELAPFSRHSYLFNTDADEMQIATAQLNEITTYQNALVAKVQAAIAIVDSMVSDEGELTVNVKLPEKLDLKGVSGVINEFDKILDQVFSDKKIDCKYSFSGFDVGTDWVAISLSSIIGVNIVGSLVWAATVIRKKIIEGNILQKNAEALKIKNESLQDIKEANKKMLDLLTRAEAENLANKHGLSQDDNEYTQRIIVSIRKLAELIMEGAEVHPALLAPEESKNLFPDFKMLDQVQSDTKQLKEG